MKRELSRPWDTFEAYLFDIDGTLLNCRDAVHYFAFCDALSTVAGRAVNLDGVVCHGNTDEGILRDAFILARLDESVWRGRMEEVRERIGAQVERDVTQLQIEVLPAVPQVLAHLRDRGALLSTATGNLARVGEAKLRRCGLRGYFSLGGWSDGCETRAEVFRHALQGVLERLGPHAAVCVVGDTPADVQAAHANGLEVIAVATGIYDQATLLENEPELCIASLEELHVVGVR